LFGVWNQQLAMSLRIPTCTLPASDASLALLIPGGAMTHTILETIKVAAVFLLFAGILGYAWLLARAFLFNHEATRVLLNSNPGTNYGLPFSAMASFGIVSVLELANAGQLKFKAIGFDFEGPAAQVTLWIVCFVVFVWAMKSVSK
jgi:hypothetical protein